MIHYHHVEYIWFIKSKLLIGQVFNLNISLANKITITMYTEHLNDTKKKS